MDKVKSKFNFQKIKTLVLKNKKIFIPAVILVIVIGFFMFRSDNSNTLSVDSVVLTNLVRSVRATGQVVSNIDLDLSFNKSGVVKSVKVSVGDVVGSGQVLANLDQGQALASVTEARGKLLSAKAKYQKTLEGSSNEEVALAEVTLKNTQKDLENTKNTQINLVANAYRTLLNSSVSAYSDSTSSTDTPPTVSGTYVLGKEGDIKINVSLGGNGGYFSTSGLVNTLGIVSTTTAQPIGDTGLFIIFPTNYNSQNTWTISLPNKKGTNYLTNLNAYKSALETQTSSVSTAQSLVDQKQAELNWKKAGARGSDLDIAQADILSAEGSLQSAQSAYEDTVIRAPATGTITKVDIKYGELAENSKAVITLQDISNLYIEALINEANIVYLKNGQSVDVTFDAFGKDKKFTGIIAHIDPSSEASDGVVNYKIKVALSTKDTTIRPGMNANIDILAGGVDNVLAIPSIALIKRDDKTFINVITNEKKKKYEEREVQAGFIGDNNLVEITSGLTQGQKVVLTK